MIYSFLHILYILFALSIVVSKGLMRFVLLLVGAFYIPGNMSMLPNALLMGHSLYVVAFIISMVIHKENLIASLRGWPSMWPIFGIFITLFLVGATDSRLGFLLGSWRGVVYFLNTFFLALIGWISLPNSHHYSSNDEHRLEKSIRGILRASILICVYGAITAVFKQNPLLDSVGLEGRFNMEGIDNYRSFRVTGTNISSSVYGLACSVFFLCGCVFLKNKSFLDKVSLVLLFSNIFLSATRAAIIPFIIAALLYVLLRYNLVRILRYASYGVIICLVSYLLLPSFVLYYIGDVIGSLTDVFFGSGGSAYGGSNMDARSTQITAAFSYIYDHPFFGHGIGYATEVLMRGAKHSLLLGLESYLCFIFIDMGLIYFLLLVLFFISQFSFYYLNKKCCSDYSQLGIVLLVMYTLYLVYAWVGGSWFFIMPIFGLISKILYLKRNNNIRICKE